MAKKGTFLLLLGERFTPTAAMTWGDDCSKQVGRIDTNNFAVTFDSTNYPGELGDVVLVTCDSGGGGTSVIITPAPFGNSAGDVAVLPPGDVVAVVYTEDGWLFMSNGAIS
jgi:hypothetical protein